MQRRRPGWSRSLTGAWIETSHRRFAPRDHAVAPSRERGLKLGAASPARRHQGVAPSRERGLKLRNDCRRVPSKCVAPSRERGLKQDLQAISAHRQRRRSLTGAWIETFPSTSIRKPYPRRSLTGAWIETPTARRIIFSWRGRSLTGAWIETSSASRGENRQAVAPSRERGLKQAATVTVGPGDKSLPHGSVD